MARCGEGGEGLGVGGRLGWGGRLGVGGARCVRG